MTGLQFIVVCLLSDFVVLIPQHSFVHVKQTVDTTKVGRGTEKTAKKEPSKVKDPLSSGFIDPLSSGVADPLSFRDPLSAALFTPTTNADTSKSPSKQKVSSRWSLKLAK